MVWVYGSIGGTFWAYYFMSIFDVGCCMSVVGAGSGDATLCLGDAVFLVDRIDGQICLSYCNCNRGVCIN